MIELMGYEVRCLGTRETGKHPLPLFPLLFYLPVLQAIDWCCEVAIQAATASQVLCRGVLAPSFLIGNIDLRH